MQQKKPEHFPAVSDSFIKILSSSHWCQLSLDPIHLCLPSLSICLHEHFSYLFIYLFISLDVFIALISSHNHQFSGNNVREKP